MVTVLCLALLTRAVEAQRTDHSRVDLIKAGMVGHFLDYTEWPDSSFEEEQSPLVLTIVGNAPVAAAIVDTLPIKHKSGRSIAVRRLSFPTVAPGETEITAEQMQDFHRRLRASHAVFIAQSEDGRLRSILAILERADVLTISDIPSFAEFGGMLGLAERGGKMAFDANEEVIRTTKLKVSSKLLRMARIVQSRER